MLQRQLRSSRHIFYLEAIRTVEHCSVWETIKGKLLGSLVEIFSKKMGSGENF